MSAPESVFLEPVETKRGLAHEVWEDGGNVYPSGRDRLGTVAFVSPSNGKGGVGIYASLWKLDHERMIPGLFNLRGIPRVGTVYLYDETGRVPLETRKRVMEILKERGLEMVARISANGNGWEVPMTPIDVGGGQIRFEGWVPARPEFVGDHKAVIEVRWRGQWHRLNEKGWFRIHPLDSNGLKLRLPAAQKYKLWVSPTGQPVVIGWTPQRKLDLSTDPRVPIADQPYWIRFWDGRAYLLSREHMEEFGFSYSPDRPDLREGEPIVEAAIDVDPAGGIVEVPSSQLFEDQDGTLGARLRKSFQVLGIRWRLEEPPPVTSAEAGGLAHRMAKGLEEVHTAGQLRDFFAELEEEAGGWEGVVAALNQISPADRDGLLRLIHNAFDRWAHKSTSGEALPPPPVIRVSREPPLRGQAGPRILRVDGPMLAVFSLNGVRDLTVRRRKDLSGETVEGILIGGGGPLAVARAASNLHAGAQMMVVAMGLGESGERLFEGLQEDGFTELQADAVLQPVPAEGQESRLSVNGSVSSSPTVSTKQVQQAVDLMLEKISAHGPGGTLVIGEHLVRVSDSDDPHGVAKKLADQARKARGLGWQTAVAASNSWDKKTYQQILETQPHTFHLDLGPFARLVDSSEEALLYRPKEELAELADQIRRLYGVERFIVSLKTAGEILVTPSGWFAAVPSPALQLSYVTGERDVVLGVFLRLLQKGVPVKESLEQAVTAGVLHMEGWGRPVTEWQIEENRHRANAYELLRPVAHPPQQPVAGTQPAGTEVRESAVSPEPRPPVLLRSDQKWKEWQQVTFLPAPDSPRPDRIIREILKQLPLGAAPAAQVLIGPGALAGSAGVPALWPLLIELKAALPDEEWRAVQKRLILYTEDQGLSRALLEAGYIVPTKLESLNRLLAWKAEELVFYMGQEDWLLRGQIPGVTQSVQLTPENYLSVLGRLLERVGFVRPEPLQLEGLPEALMEAA